MENNVYPIVFVPWQPALPYADEVLPHFIGIAQTGVEWLHLLAQPSGKAQNMAVQAFLDRENTHIIMMDWDHKHPIDIVERLCKTVAENPEIKILGCLNFARTEPHYPCVWIEREGKMYRPHKWQPHVGKVDLIGFGAIIISREVFEAIEPPWFMYDFSDMADYQGYQYPGSDIFFCRKAKEHGFDIWCDYSITSPHATSRWIAEKDYEND